MIRDREDTTCILPVAWVRLMKKIRKAYFIVLAFLLLAFVFSVAVGAVYIPPGTIGKILASEAGFSFEVAWPDSYEAIIYQVRLPHVVLVMMTGAALAGSGAAFQGLFRNPLADPYLTLLNDYIKPCLIHFAMVEYYPHAAYTIANKGVYKHGAENSETVSKEEVDFLMEKQRQLAMNYKERFVDYVINNSSSFPEYYSNTAPDVYPDQNTNMTGWVL